MLYGKDLERETEAYLHKIGSQSVTASRNGVHSLMEKLMGDLNELALVVYDIHSSLISAIVVRDLGVLQPPEPVDIEPADDPPFNKRG